jgi:TonB-dependent starch-binding outer membrane protein SusC
MKTLIHILFVCLSLTTLAAQESQQDTSARNEPKKQLFSAGMIHHPLQLIQGRIPGLLVVRPGADPNDRFDARLRGFHTMGAAYAAPLLLVDGFPQVSAYSLDPADIDSIEVLDPAKAATYGLRSGSGLIHIHTRRLVDTGWTIRYNGALALELLSHKPPMLHAAEFRRLYDTPGTVAFRPDANLGAETDWIQAVTRTGSGHWHQALLGYRGPKTQYQLALHARNMAGIIRNTGYEQLNGRFHVGRQLFSKRLQLEGSLSHTRRLTNHVVPEVYRLATVLNPTMPLRSDTAIQTAGYAQLPYFSIANPVSIIEQMTNRGEIGISTAQAQARLQLGQRLIVSGQFALQEQHDFRELIAPPTEYYLGLSNQGFAERQSEDTGNRFSNMAFQYQPASFIRLRGAHQWQRTYTRQHIFRGTNLTDTYQTVSNNSFQEAHTTASFWLASDLSYKRISAIAMLRREGSSTLGSQEKWTWNPLFQLSLDIRGLDGIEANIRSTYSLSGNAPRRSYLSQTVYGPNAPFYYDGQYIPSLGPIHYGNPGLRPERRKEWFTELNLSSADQRIHINLTYFNSNSTDLIRRVNLRQTIAGIATNDLMTYANVADIRNQGLLATFEARLLERSDFSWDAALNLWVQRSRFGVINRTPYNQEAFAGYGFIGFSASGYLFELAEGTAPGTIYAPVYEGINDQGRWQFRDDNNDGSPDRVAAGNAHPGMGMGWHNTLRWRGWDLQAFVRGLFGHARVDPIRMSTSSVFTRPGYNLNQSYIRPLREFAFYSDYFVEPASYVRLDNLVLGYTISSDSGHTFAGWRCYVAAQNLLTLSSFQFSDPEPLLAFPEGDNTALLHTGTYFQAKTISFGIEARF